MKCVVRKLVAYYCVVQVNEASDAFHVAAALPERAWQPTHASENTYQIDEPRNEQLRNWEFPHTHTWQRDGNAVRAVNAAGDEIDRELSERQKREKQRRAEREQFSNKEAA